MPVLLHLALLGALWFLDAWGGFVIVASALLGSGERCGRVIALLTTVSVLLNAGLGLWVWWGRTLGPARAGLLGAHTAVILLLGWLGLWASVRSDVPGSPPYGERPWTKGMAGVAWILVLVVASAAVDGVLVGLLTRR